MTAYIIADIEITDAEGYKEYRAKVPAVIAAYGGRYLARGGVNARLEGDWVPQRTIVLEFPSMAQLKEFWSSPAYAPLLEIRQRSSKSRLLAVEGLAQKEPSG